MSETETQIHPKKARRPIRAKKIKSNDNNGGNINNSGNVQAGGKEQRPKKTKSNDNNGDDIADSGNVQAEEKEEQRPRLQRAPLQEKLEEIISKCGLKSYDTDVEKCLYWCLEERIRGLIRNLIRVSKQRADSEKSRRSVTVNSDVQKQILQMNKMAMPESEKQPAEEDVMKLIKVCKEKEYNMLKKKAANVAVRAAVGGDDKVAKWQAMAEEAQRKQGIAQVEKGQSDTAAAFDHDKKVRKSTVAMPESRTISVIDVISVLEREPQMAKSLLLYNLYERVRTRIGF